MKQPNQLSRRDVLVSVSALAVTSAVMPKLLPAARDEKDAFVVVNGWVLKRSETA